MMPMKTTPFFSNVCFVFFFIKQPQKIQKLQNLVQVFEKYQDHFDYKIQGYNCYTF